MFTSVKNPRWSEPAHRSVTLDVLLEGEEGYVPFAASPSDCTTHGPLLYNLAVDGLFGPVQDSDYERMLRGDLPLPEGHTVIGGVIYNDAEQAGLARARVREALEGLTAPEAVARAELDEGYAAERLEKMRGLLDIEQQPGFPYDVDWAGLL